MKAKKINRFRLLLQVIFVAVLFGVVLGYPKVIVLDGDTMGTTYHIKAYVPFWRKTARIDSLIKQRLAQVNQIFSTYDDNSELSLLNRNTSKEAIQVTKDLYQVLHQASVVFEKTKGAFDMTVYPLYELWGFMSETPLIKTPTHSEIKDTFKKVGTDKIKFLGPGQIQKIQPDLQCDLSAIAKGYAVDELRGLLERIGSKHFIVEIGGEIYASGQRNRSEKWRCGISIPHANAAPNELLYTVAIKNKALATSGDYRNFQTIESRTYPHILDPRTGYPIQHNTVSATVIAESCALADALATAAMVLSPKEALALVEKNKKAEILLVEKHKKEHVVHMSGGFSEFILEDHSKKK
ncbi:MAG: FAD:protein FMN transferase [bacterium]